jgi:phosphatidylserine/phosphatidylglycerophosphate/cardiolipin synthase-like enzyme
MLTRFTTALAAALTATVLVATPALAWAPPSGATFNNPKGTTAAKYRLQLRVEKAIRNAAPGSKVLIATYLMDRQPPVDALIGARNRGVSVQVVLDGGIDNGPSRRLVRSLNADNGRRGLEWGPDQSFAMQCTGSCRGGAPNQAMHAKFYAFSHTGTAHNVVMVSSANLNKGGATLGYNDMYTMRGVPATFALYERVHAEMARDRVAGDPYRVLRDGRFLTRIFPKRGADSSSDPAFQALKRVRCSGATGSAGVRGHTAVRVSMFHWGGDRGVYLARKLVGLDRAGCVVSVIYGAPSSEVSRILRDSAHRGGIALYDSRVDRNGDHHPDLRVHTKYMLIGGSYGGDTSSWQVFTGSQNWVKQSLTGGDENTLQISSRADHGRYVDNFDFVRLHGSRKIG